MRALAWGLAVACLGPILAADAAAGDAVLDRQQARRWGLGWDAANNGPALFHRPGAGWELCLAGGPEDRKTTDYERAWADDLPVEAEELYRVDDRRAEAGWVELWGDRRIWGHGRFSLGVGAGARYAWSNEQDSYRTFRTYDSDYYNLRKNSETDTWTLYLGIHPRWALAERVSLEFRTGYYYRTTTTFKEQLEWYDSLPEVERRETETEDHYAGTFGPYDFTNLTVVFWF